MTASIAQALLSFLKQTNDVETLAVLKHLDQHKPRLKKEPKKIALSPLLPPLQPVRIVAPEPFQEPPATQKGVAPSFGIFERLHEKVKKACPELSIKTHLEELPLSVPDCDVLLLCQKTIPDVYSALLKAIDAKLGFAESLLMDNSLIPALLNRSFKALLVPPFLQKWSSFMQHIRKIAPKKQAYFGSSPVIFLEEASLLSNDPNLKGALWQTLKTLLA